MARPVTDSVTLLEIAWPEPVGANAYLVDDGELTLVDAGLPFPRRSLRRELQNAGYAATELDRVLVTHYDVDHVGGLARFDPDVPIYIGSLDHRLVRRSWSPPWRHHKGAFHRLIRRIYSLSEFDLRPVSDGDRVGSFRAFHTPGHNPGHTVFLHPDAGVAMLGDLVWNTDRGFVPPPWVDSYDTDQMAESIARIAEQPFEAACMGHGPPVSDDGHDRLAALAADLGTRR
jgi:glyoxylase-like metal-dependent hydrolase (beta-lactamase superfamily II)